MANAKAAMKYKVVTGRNPKTGATLMRPVITGRENYNLDQVVAYALNANYVRGQFHDLRGTLNGFIESMQQLGKEGKSVCLNNWLRIHGELTGTVGESRQLTSANELHVAITALSDLKGDVSEFSWTNVDDTGALPKIDTLMYVGASKGGEVKKSTAILATGKNLAYNAAYGDTVVVSWLDNAEVKTLAITPSESDYSHEKFAWPDGLTDVADGTELTFTFTLHGEEGGAANTATKSVTLIAA